MSDGSAGRLRVLATRQEIRPERLEGSAAVVIDVFMTTTTVLTILENGARRVLPARSLDEAETITGTLDPEALIRGGEQMAEPVDGFDCGPFPEEYPAERVRGKDVIYLSTNGTAAIADASPASRIFLATVRNAPAVADHLRRLAPEVIDLVCAGSLGRLTLDDLVGAGCVLAAMDTAGRKLNDAAWLAEDLTRRHADRIPELLRQARSGRWFFEHDREETFEFVADVGASDLVPEVRSGEVVPVETPTRGEGP